MSSFGFRCQQVAFKQGVWAHGIYIFLAIADPFFRVRGPRSGRHPESSASTNSATRIALESVGRKPVGLFKPLLGLCGHPDQPIDLEYLTINFFGRSARTRCADGPEQRRYFG